MPSEKQIAEFDLEIDNLRMAIAALRAGNAGRAELDRALSELARVKAQRVRLMLHQVNFSAERRLHRATAASGPNDGDASAARPGSPDGLRSGGTA